MNCNATFVYLNCYPSIAHGHYLQLITKTTNITAKNFGFLLNSKTFPLLNFKQCPKGLTKNGTTYFVKEKRMLHLNYLNCKQEQQK